MVPDRGGAAVKRLSGWDAVLLYSEAPNVHMHTLKVAVIELQDRGGLSFGVEEFREVIRGRLYKRRFATATLALSDVKETSKHLGVTINDIVLATAAGALRSLLLRYDGVADHPLLASVPVSFNFDPDRVSGNYFTGMMVALPVDVAHPLQRVRETHDAAVTAKEGNQLVGPELISRWSAYLPPAPAQALFKWLSAKDGQNKVMNLPISNVPGPRERGRVGGALVTEIYSVGPLTAGSGMNITVWSYVDQLNVSVLTDGATVDDPHEATDAMLQEFSEIRSAAGLPGELTVVETAMAQA
jgi:diacylglycerol O-acyltransferase